jgi:hypothetical protein
MQVNDSTSPSFKALTFKPKALGALSKRMPSGRFISIQEKLAKKYEASPFDIVIDTVSAESSRLCAKIKQSLSAETGAKIQPKYVEETILSSVFNRSEKFLEKLCKIIDQKEFSILGKKSRSGRDLMV